MKYQREAAIDVMEDLIPLIIKHHQEISRFKDLKLKPDFQKYVQYDNAGFLRIFTARDDGELIGYLLVYVRESLHFQTKEAVQDALFITPKKRGFGVNFLKWCEAQLRLEGIEFLYQHVNVHHDFSPILIRMGYEHLDSVYVKRLTQHTESMT